MDFGVGNFGPNCIHSSLHDTLL